MRRFETPRLRDPATGYQCWDVDAIERELREGLVAAAALGPLHSVGVDGWGVDYVLLDARLQRVAPAVSYRDGRTRGVPEHVFASMPRSELYRRSGIQFQPFNTLYQLAATARQQPQWLASARHLLLLPDYFHQRLGAAPANEYTNATTTQLVGVERGDWDEQLLALAGISRELLSALVEPGTVLGEAALPVDGAARGSHRVQIIAPGTHDTASAVAALPLQPGEAFLVSGTWSLLGVESEQPLAGEAALRCNVSNEGGLQRRYRVLKNIAGLWLTQRIAQELGRQESELLAEAGDAPAWQASIDPDDGRFLNPASMIDAIRGFCMETGQQPPADGGALVRCALESLALCYRRTQQELEQLLARPLTRLHIGGGGGRNALLNQLTADACQLPVQVGPAEASLLGNACAQLIGLGAFASLAEARAALRRSFGGQQIEPRRAVPDAARERFVRLGRAAARGEPS